MTNIERNWTIKIVYFLPKMCGVCNVTIIRSRMIWISKSITVG